MNIENTNGFERITINKVDGDIIEILEKLITERVYNNTFALHMHPEIALEFGDTIKWVTDPDQECQGIPLDYRIGVLKIKEIDVNVVSSALVNDKRTYLIPLPKNNDYITVKYYPDYTVDGINTLIE